MHIFSLVSLYVALSLSQNLALWNFRLFSPSR